MGLHGTLKSSYLAAGRLRSNNRLSDVKWFLEQEANTWKNRVAMSPQRRLWLWQRGFTSPCGELYDFDTYGPELYLSELQKVRLYESVNGDHRYLLDDKLSQHWMLADYPENRPDAYGILDRGYLHGVTGTEHEGDPVPVADWLPEAVRSHSSLVLKQLRGLGGSEVLVCEYDDGFVLDGERVTEERLCAVASTLSSYLATEYVCQHAYADDLYEDATNTIRLLTVWDDETGEVVLGGSIHRIGTDRSRPVDNWSRGGLTVDLDPETGELGRATRKPRSGELEWYSAHPDTGAAIEGKRVPNWEAVRSTVDRIARDNTHIPIVGWDVLLDTAGEPIVLEANTGTDLDLLQVHGPLLEDSRVARVVSRHLPSVDPSGRPA